MFRLAIRQKRRTDYGEGASESSDGSDLSGDISGDLSGDLESARPSLRPAGLPSVITPRLSSPETLRQEADEFLTDCYTELGLRAELPERRRAVAAAIDADGTYDHTFAELEYGVRVAWRNSARCIGRLYWRSLKLRDRRQAATPVRIAAECVSHLRAATNGGRIRPVVTVFAPDRPGSPGPRIHNEQLIRYAGYRVPDGESAERGLARVGAGRSRGRRCAGRPRRRGRAAGMEVLRPGVGR